jgi:Fe-S cluster assembly iron-binding protein IscA
MMLRCTASAAAVLQELRERNSIPGNGVRLFAVRSSGGDIRLGMNFTDQPSAGDEVTQQHGTTVIVAPEIAQQVAKLTLDVVPDPSSNGERSPQLVLRPSDEV